MRQGLIVCGAMAVAFAIAPGAKILMTAWLIAMSVKAKGNLNMNAGDVKDMDRLNALGAKGEVH